MVEDSVSNIFEIGHEISHVLSSSAKLFQSLRKLRDSFDKNNPSKINDLELYNFVQDALSDALEMQEALVERDSRIRQLEEELSRQNDWNEEKHRYVLKPIAIMSFAYCLKDEYVNEEEPVHLLCVHCASNSIKSLLHKVDLNEGSRLQCPRCKQYFGFSYNYMTKEI